MSLIPLAPFDKESYMKKVPTTNLEEGLMTLATMHESTNNGTVQGPQQLKEMS